MRATTNLWKGRVTKHIGRQQNIRFHSLGVTFGHKNATTSLMYLKDRKLSREVTNIQDKPFLKYIERLINENTNISPYPVVPEELEELVFYREPNNWNCDISSIIKEQNVENMLYSGFMDMIGCDEIKRCLHYLAKGYFVHEQIFTLYVEDCRTFGTSDISKRHLSRYIAIYNMLVSSNVLPFISIEDYSLNSKKELSEESMMLMVNRIAEQIGTIYCVKDSVDLDRVGVIIDS